MTTFICLLENIIFSLILIKAEWFTCKRVLIKTNPEKPESPSIEGAYCPIAAYI